jgi:hypothetical protein
MTTRQAFDHWAGADSCSTESTRVLLNEEAAAGLSELFPCAADKGIDEDLPQQPIKAIGGMLWVLWLHRFSFYLLMVGGLSRSSAPPQALRAVLVRAPVILKTSKKRLQRPLL